MKKDLIYVAGPYSQGDTAINVRNAIEIGMTYNDMGYYAVIPHMTHFLHLLFPRPYEYWLELDNRILPYCKGFHRIEGPSSGADKEMEFAKSLGLKIL
jgi:hypothetical protein